RHSKQKAPFPEQLRLDICPDWILTIILCAKSSNPTRDLVRSRLRKDRCGSACAVFQRINRFAMDRTRRPETKNKAKPTSTTIKATGGQSVSLEMVLGL